MRRELAAMAAEGRRWMPLDAVQLLLACRILAEATCLAA